MSKKHENTIYSADCYKGKKNIQWMIYFLTYNLYYSKNCQGVYRSVSHKNKI